MQTGWGKLMPFSTWLWWVACLFVFVKLPGSWNMKQWHYSSNIWVLWMLLTSMRVPKQVCVTILHFVIHNTDIYWHLWERHLMTVHVWWHTALFTVCSADITYVCLWHLEQHVICLNNVIWNLINVNRKIRRKSRICSNLLWSQDRWREI
jgi:hypothetical protein